ncbi:hypothetical protein GH714_032826 [Hevea brasiliensis]|uniref:Enoyl reductase (ER) domain-containing protein n=1 Tax=Hevea brasiliensis TaxID=3981 RepID=A0A6A6LKX6_HEVBR|nr:hypothetical protein GH714_032826 [Hevea brasiliensis]
MAEGSKVIGWAARDSSGHLSPHSFNLRKTGEEDVVFKVLYSGVDHTDLHVVRGEIHSPNYPLVPGHEVVGEVVESGKEVKKFKVGDIVGVGCIIWSCGECLSCKSKMEQYCHERILTYNAIDKDGRITQGGFSSAMVVNQRWSWSLRCDYCKGNGASCDCNKLFSKKREEALEHLGADAFLVSSNADEMEKAANSLDYILDTVPAGHPLDSYLSLLKVDGKVIIVGAAPTPLQFIASDLITGKRNICGSFVGSIEDTQEILEFWAEKGLTSMIEIVKIDYVNEAFKRMERNDVRYRFVLDVAGSNHE